MRVICFYLPQFHPIEENDRWWGPGFTEWTNVAQAKPRFTGHYQPHIPGQLGFYDLRLGETRVAQAEMAAAHGIDGFCYYHYWFNGKLLLERPLNEVLASGEPDFPFCVCWANESWSRRWDGGDRQLLMPQDYKAYDPAAHMGWLSRVFRDQRYMMVDGKPMFVVYKPSDIPELGLCVERWREAARSLGFADLYLCGVMSVNDRLTAEQMMRAGFDVAIDFMPRREVRGPRRVGNFVYTLPLRAYNKALRTLGLDRRLPLAPVTNVFSYRRLVRNAISRWDGDTTVVPCVVPSWDNSARKKTDADVYQNDDPHLYGHWLRAALRVVRDRPQSRRMVFINAWNEWAEGCHLEPDRRFGVAYLEQTRAAIQSQAGVSKDAHV